MLKKIYIAVLLILLVSAALFPVQSKHADWQKLTLDEMKETLKRVAEPKSRIDLLNLLAYKLKDFDYKSAGEFAELALTEAKENEYPEGETDSLNIKGSLLLRQGKADDAKGIYNEAKSIASVKYKEYASGEAEALLGLYNCYRTMGQFDTAFSRLLDVQRLLNSEKTSNHCNRDRAEARLMQAFGEIANLDVSRKAFQEKIIDFYQRSTAIQEKIGDPDSKAIALCDLGDICQQFERYKEAESFFEKAGKLNGNIKNPYVQGKLLTGKGVLLFNRAKNYDAAMLAFTESRKIFGNIGDIYQGLLLDQTMGETLFRLNKLEEAEKKLNGVLSKAMELKDAYGIFTVAENLKALYQKKSDLGKFEEITTISDRQKEIMGEFSASGSFRHIVEAEKQKERQKNQFIIAVLVFGGILLILAFILMNLRKRQVELKLTSEKANSAYKDDLLKKEKANSQLKDELLEKEKENSNLKDEWMYTLAHEYKTPLATIKMASDVLARYFPQLQDNEIRDRLGNIDESVGKLDSLIKKIMELSREFNPSIHDLGEICRKFAAEKRDAHADTHDIVFSSSGEKILAYVDSDLLGIILENLLSNSVKYSEIGTRIELSLDVNGDNGIIKVRDYGRGIPEEFLKQSDKRFHRAKNVQDIDGTGLGLSIAERHVKLHNGIMDITSAVGEGTTVTIQIPLAR